MLRRLKNIALERGGLLGLACLAAYVWAAPPHVVDSDNAELSMLSVTGGAAHPSGYPLYVMWLRAWSYLPLGTAAHTAAIATAVLGVAAVLALRAACRAWGARPAAASIATALYAGSPIVFRTHSEAEVFALNALVVALVLWVAAAEGPLRGERRAAVLGLLGGLGIANHLTAVLIAPVGVLGAIRGIREATRGPWRAGALAAGGLVLGLAPYAYLLAAPDTPGSWSAVHGIGDVIAFVTRADYGGVGAFAAQGEPERAANVMLLVRSLGRAYLWLPALAGVAMLGWRCAKPSSGEPRLGWAMLAISLSIAGPLLALRFNLAPVGVARFTVERFHLLPILLLAIPVAVALDRVALSPLAAQAAAVVVLAAAVVISLPDHQRVSTRAVQAGALNVLGSLPPNAVLFSRSDDLYFGGTYAQTVLGVRPDVVQIAWGLSGLPWYRERLARRGVSIEPGSSVRAAQQALATGRPVFADLLLGGILAAFPTYPHGAVFRVLPPGARPPSIDAIVALNQQLYAGFDLDYPRPGPDDGYPTALHSRYAQAWVILARSLAAAGRTDDAKAAIEVARDVGPRTDGN